MEAIVAKRLSCVLWGLVALSAACRLRSNSSGGHARAEHGTALQLRGRAGFLVASRRFRQRRAWRSVLACVLL